MFFQNWHIWSHNLTLSLFSHDHQWLHIIVHTVLVVMPTLLACIIIWKAYRAIREHIAKLAIQKAIRYNNESFHSIPQYLLPFIKRYTFRSQILLALGALLTLPITFASLELPKRIINGAVNTENFVSNPIAFSLNQVDYLLVLCGLYLIILILNGILKFR